MKVGVFSILPDAAADPAIVAKHAEDLGFASYWVPDHIILPVKCSTPYPGNPKPGTPDPDYLWQMPDPLIALMRAATATTTLEVGTGCCWCPSETRCTSLKKLPHSIASAADVFISASALVGTKKNPKCWAAISSTAGRRWKRPSG